MKELENKVLDTVFSKSALMTLHSLASQGIIKSMGGPISTGKEAVVHEAVGENGKVAVKMYKIETSNYRKMVDYLRGDPRFAGTKKDRRSVIFSFVQKEYRNLLRAFEVGIRCPRALAYKGNVLVMSFIGIDDSEDPAAAPQLRKAKLEDPQEVYDKIMEDVKTLYNKAGLVHGDLSEYNILMADEPYMIDVSQSVLKSHPRAGEFLERDIMNVSRYFEKFSIEIEDPAKVFNSLVHNKEYAL
ncbi:serine protein kinase RIO [Candidatus Undinarchaeota archaeon]